MFLTDLPGRARLALWRGHGPELMDRLFPNLLRPGRIGPMVLRNRLVMSPMETTHGTPDGLPSERTRDYFAARAKGGAGLVTVGASVIVGDRTGLGLIRKATEDGARAACSI